MKALLLDLDDTLLTNEASRFFPAYFELISRTMQDVVSAPEFLRQLQAGTRAMLANRDPARTLRESFAGVFYPPLGRTEDELYLRFEDFYLRVFPALRDVTEVRPAARALVDQARAAGLTLAVATNPVLPLLAIEERLRWAGVPSQDGRYALVTSYEEFHFAKPDPAYFAEVTGRLGLEPADAGMVGNDVENDLEPARGIGLATYHVAESPDPAHGGGGLERVLQWASHPAPPPTGPDPRPLSVKARLRGYLAALRAMSSSFSPEDWARRPSTDEWSPVEIVCHLRDVDREVNLPRLRKVLGEDGPFISAVTADEWAAERRYREEDGRRALEDFTAIRKDVLERLDGLEAADWTRPARHALLGPTTLGELMAVACAHDILHLAQLHRAHPSL
jgi:FMN phosphatase YigB (HAD superfamily)